jgi:hypothetical protein
MIIDAVIIRLSLYATGKREQLWQGPTGMPELTQTLDAKACHGFI